MKKLGHKKCCAEMNLCYSGGGLGEVRQLGGGTGRKTVVMEGFCFIW